MSQGENDKAMGRQARMVAVVIATVMILWLGGQWLGPELGLPARYVFLFDFLALAGFAWCLIVTWQIWKKRKGDEPSQR